MDGGLVMYEIEKEEKKLCYEGKKVLVQCVWERKERKNCVTGNKWFVRYI